MDKELIAYLDARFKEIAQQMAVSREEIAALREETSRRFENLEGSTRHAVVLIEGLRHELHLVAESVFRVSERLERYRKESVVAFDQVKGWVEPYFRELSGHIRNLDDRAYLLDGRFGSLGIRVDSIDGRVNILEGRADRQQGDVMDAIRKMLGKPPLSPPATSE